MTSGPPEAAPSECAISVVVPVYNPGAHIDRLLESLRRQSLSPECFEAIFVDDGSTDGTPERLDAFAARHPNVRVIRIERSGWPGKPRNVGVGAARGEYVQFVDHDDWLGDQALERLLRYARANRSDVVVGREIRPRSRRAMGRLYRVNRPHATLEHDPLLQSLSPHKMFRRAFLLEHDIRFPEGPRRLEDHPFVVKAYFRAEVVSVLADYPCYYWNTPRPDRGNAGLRPREWAEWYGYVGEALDVVEEHTEPGPFRDRLFSHWYSTKGLRYLGSLSTRPDPVARELFDALRALAAERYPPSVDEHLTPILRVRSALLRAGAYEATWALSVAERGITLDPEIHRLRSFRGRLSGEVSATLVYADGSPVLLERHGDRWYLRPPVPLGDAVPSAALDFTGAMAGTHLDVVARHTSTHERIVLPGESVALPGEPHGVAGLGASRTFRLDPGDVRRLSMVPGTWEIDLQVNSCGWNVRADPGPRPVTVRIDRRGRVALRR